jgi:hypothetical protein
MWIACIDIRFKMFLLYPIVLTFSSGSAFSAFIDEDVRLFLLSRYGIDVTVDDVRKTILSGMGGGAEENEVIDAMEVMAILMIPVLRKAAEIQKGTVLPDGISAPPKELLDLVLTMILTDVSASSAYMQLLYS